MANIVWPYKPLAPRRCRPVPTPITSSGGRTLSSKEIVTAPDAGFWSIAYAEVPLASNTAKYAWKSVSGLARGRTNWIDVPIYDTDTAPWPIVNGLPVPGIPQVPHSDGAFFSDGSGYWRSLIPGVVDGDFAMGVISVTLRMYGGSALQPGMHFSALGTSGKYRLFRITDVNSVTPVTGSIVYGVSVWPPNREDIPDGTMVQFDYPLCTCRLQTDREMETGIDDYAGRTQASVNFVEALP